jgi:hypothetical protein
MGPQGPIGITGPTGILGPTATITSVYFISGSAAAYSNGFTGISTFVISPGTGITGAAYVINWTLNEIITTGPTGCSAVYINFYDGVTTYEPININGVTSDYENASVMYSIQGATFSNQTTSVSDYVDLSNWTGAAGINCNIYQINNNTDANPVQIQSYKMALRMTQQ